MYAVKAVYRKGQIEFIEPPPPNKEDVDVLIIFPESHRNEEKGEKSLRFHGTPEMDRLLREEPDWKPPGFIRR